MATKIDSHLKKLTTFSIASVFTLWFAWGLLSNKVLLETTYRDVQKYFFAVALLEANTSENSDILDRAPDSKPSKGLVVPTIASWGTPDKEVTGEITLMNGWVLRFKRKGDIRNDDKVQVYQIGLIDAEHSVDIQLVVGRAQSSDENWGLQNENPADLLNVRQLEAEVIGLGNPWVSAAGSAEPTFFALRERLRETVTLPFVDVLVHVENASWSLAVFSFVLSVLLIHTAIGLHSIGTDRIVEDPWLIVAPSKFDSTWLNILSRAIWILALLTYIVMIVTSIGVAIVAICLVPNGSSIWLQYSALVLVVGLVTTTIYLILRFTMTETNSTSAHSTDTHILRHNKRL